MKKIVRILAGLVMGLMCVNCASARSGNEEKVSETRSVNPFHSIEVESVASVYFTQSDTYSLRVEGEKKWVDQTKCTVKDGVLLIAWAEKGKKTTRNVKERKENYPEREWTLYLHQCTRFAESSF